MPQLHYWISNNGDGSASIQLAKSAEQARKEDEKQSRDGEGWGEECTGSVELKTENGKIFYADSQWKGGKWIQKWVELKD